MNEPVVRRLCHVPSRLDVINAMIDYGGGFVRRLGEAWLAADADNNRRLLAAFPHYWEQYSKAASDRAAHEARRLAESRNKPACPTAAAPPRGDAS